MRQGTSSKVTAGHLLCPALILATPWPQRSLPLLVNSGSKFDFTSAISRIVKPGIGCHGPAPYDREVRAMSYADRQARGRPAQRAGARRELDILAEHGNALLREPNKRRDVSQGEALVTKSPNHLSGKSRGDTLLLLCLLACNLEFFKHSLRVRIKNGRNLNSPHINAKQRRGITNHVGDLIKPTGLSEQARNLVNRDRPPTVTARYACRHVLCHVTRPQIGSEVSRGR